MNSKYSNAISFILEGETEKVFYLTLLQHYCNQHAGWSMERKINSRNGEIYYEIDTANHVNLIKLHVAGAITNMPKTADWFLNRCKGAHPNLSWTVFLCYDTDNYQADVTKFYEGDWKELRNQILEQGDTIIIDLAVSADIEDTMLLDAEGIFNYLSMAPVEIPHKNKGKSKLKAIFKQKNPRLPYHEGERAEPLIQSLDMEKIISRSPICFGEIEKALTGV